MSDCLPLLFDSRSGEHIAFSPPKQNILRSGSFSYGDRAEHANRILKEFDTILDEKAKQRIKRVSIETPYGKDFPVESLNKNDMELLDWREFGENHVATVLLPKDADENLRKKITDFRDSDTAKGRPKNEQLVGRIKSFKRAIPYWYWKDSLVPIPQHDEIWIEVWLTRKEGAKEDEDFLKLCKEHQIIHGNRPLRFPECLIYPIRADKKKLEVLTANLETVKQCRAWNELSSLVSEDTPAEQVNWTQDLLSRLKVPQETAPAVCILDTGCNRHPILEPLMEEKTILGVRDEKNGSDINGHGTAMAGIAAYGSLNHVMMNAGGAIEPHAVESCRIYGEANSDRLHGEVTQQAISLIEIANPTKPRVFCLAITTPESGEKGNPSSWSAALDAAASMPEEDDSGGRLLIAAAGNRRDFQNDGKDQEEASVQNPAQAWNVLSIGGVTHLTKCSASDLPPNASLYAQDGGLSPSSTNSTTWKGSSPLKPDFLCEGGNMLMVGSLTDRPHDLQLLAPYKNPFERQFEPFDGTSLASALATHMAAAVMRAYPELRPETVRALLVHSAEWTDEMKRLYLPKPTTASYKTLARMCGHGEANLQRALSCMRNSLTLVHEGELVPYQRKDGSVSYGEMVYHELPWPKVALAELGDASVELKVTLSYFVEPNPSAIEGLESSYIYPSHRLRFSVRKSTDTRDEHVRKINKAQRADNENVPNQRQYEGWQLGQHAFVGSVHSDIWEGSAADLAAMSGIAIIPSAGWWKTRTTHKRYGKAARYSLVVSIRTKDLINKVDLYTEVQNLIRNEVSEKVEITAS